VPLQTIENANGVTGARMLGYQDFMEWKLGIAIKDWRYVACVRNVDTTELVAKSGSAADIAEMLTAALECIPNLEACNPVIYMNRTVRKMFRIQRRDDIISGGGLTYANIDGKRVIDFDGIPVKISDQLLNTESQVT